MAARKPSAMQETAETLPEIRDSLRTQFGPDAALRRSNRSRSEPRELMHLYQSARLVRGETLRMMLPLQVNVGQVADASTLEQEKRG